jgi:hypothetical protein
MGLTMLPVAYTHALRTQSELLTLVRAVRDAPISEPETDSVEWKGDWNFADASVRFNTARHLLGFGNRTPTAAAGSFEGCAYLLAGVEPQSLAGVEVLDPADLDNVLSRYIAPSQPRFTAHYVHLDDKDVLVLVVEAPRPGDPIFTLQHGHDRAQAGRIYVRRHGKTLEAGPAEVRALEARGTIVRPRVELKVVREGTSPLRAIRMSEDIQTRFAASERERLLGALPQPEPESPGWDVYSSLTRSLRVSAFDGDRRSEDEYREQVRKYLSSADRRLSALLAETVIEGDLGRLDLSIVNVTERNFRAVEVRLLVPATVEVYLSAEEAEIRLDAPEVPKPYGEDRLGSVRKQREGFGVIA